MMKPSNLVENAWVNMGYCRHLSQQSEVLAAVYGPYESRNSQKSDYKKSVVEAVVSDITTQLDHSYTEKILSELFSSVIDIEKYPYLSIMISIQIFSKDENIISTCINAGFQAIINANLQIKYQMIAKDFFNENGRITLAIVPDTDLILLSLCDNAVNFEYYKKCVYYLGRNDIR
jgi:ribonuclease PH